MKTGYSILIILILAVVLASGWSCAKQESEENVIKLEITGMTCNHCVQTVTAALESVEGVDTAIVDLENDMAEVHFTDQAPALEDMITAVEKKGYGAKLKQE